LPNVFDEATRVRAVSDMPDQGETRKITATKFDENKLIG
jgi:hypothetical protein